MIADSHSYTTLGGVNVSRSITEVKMETALEEILFYLNSQRGGLLASSYEYPGRYKRWAIGFVNPPIELSTRENAITLKALNDRGKEMILGGERKQDFRRRFGDRVAVEAVGGVKVGKVAGLAELLDSERRDPLAEDSTEPRQGGRRGIGDRHEAGGS